MRGSDLKTVNDVQNLKHSAQRETHTERGRKRDREEGGERMRVKIKEVSGLHNQSGIQITEQENRTGQSNPPPAPPPPTSASPLVDTLSHSVLWETALRTRGAQQV